MKYLQDYVNEGQTKALEKAGAFFAFSQAQYEESKVQGVEYVSGTGGLICPKANYQTLMDELHAVRIAGIEQDIAENGINEIIKRELANYECYYTSDIDDAVGALKGYGVNYEDVQKVFKSELASMDTTTL